MAKKFHKMSKKPVAQVGDVSLFAAHAGKMLLVALALIAVVMLMGTGAAALGLLVVGLMGLSLVAKMGGSKGDSEVASTLHHNELIEDPVFNGLSCNLFHHAGDDL